ncbi:MAG: hypothetical protein IPM60_10635 [Rhodospirillales bacterium]|nr:hypothetical protein [Rhodospirillales bacterium]
MFAFDDYREELKCLKSDVSRLKGMVADLEAERVSIRRALRQRKKAAKAAGSPLTGLHAATAETRPCRHCGAVIRRAAKICKVCKRAQPGNFLEMAAVEGEITRLRVELQGGVLQPQFQEPVPPAA